jgi:hypothetical protein
LSIYTPASFLDTEARVRDQKHREDPPHCIAARPAGLPLPLTKYTVSEVRQRIETPLADARGSDRSRDREGAEFLQYATVFLKPRTKWGRDSPSAAELSQDARTGPAGSGHAARRGKNSKVERGRPPGQMNTDKLSTILICVYLRSSAANAFFSI